MKFSSYNMQVNKNVINPPEVRAGKMMTDPLAFGTGGREWDGLSQGLGQVIKVYKKAQDDADAADVMEARNRISTELMKGIYGEDGLFTTGVGVNADGLFDRTTEYINKTKDNILQDYNPRVRKVAQANLNDNFINLQRSAGLQEMRERKGTEERTYLSNLQTNADLAALNYADSQFMDSIVEGQLRISKAHGMRQGWSPEEQLGEDRRVTSKIWASAVEAAIGNEDYEHASGILSMYGGKMDQQEYRRLYGAVKQRTKAIEESKDFDDIAARHTNPDGTIDMNGFMAEVNGKYGKDAKKRIQGKGGSVAGTWSGDAGIDGEINDAAREFGVDPALVAAVAQKESAFRQDATSGAGARGVMQLMPATAAGLGVNPEDRRDNIRGGAKYLKEMLDAFGGDMTLALAAYNAGPGAVKEAGGVPNYRETQDYVAKVKAAYDAFQSRKGTQGRDIVSDAAPLIGQTMSNGSNGCVEAVTKIGAKGNAFLSKELANGVVNVDRLVEHAGSMVVPFEAGKLEAGDVIVYGNNDHVVLYDGNGGYLGNSSSQNKIVHGSDYRDMDDLSPTKIIKTGGGYGTSGGTEQYVSAYNPEIIARMQQRAEARNQDIRQKAQASETLYADQLIAKIKGAGSYEAAVNIFEDARSSIPSRVIRRVKESITKYYNPPKKRLNGFTEEEIQNAQDLMLEYNTRMADEDDTISAKDQTKYNRAARLLQQAGVSGSGDNLDAGGDAVAMAEHAIEVTASDEEAEWYLIVNYEYSPGEAKRYVQMAKE